MADTGIPGASPGGNLFSHLCWLAKGYREVAGRSLYWKSEIKRGADQEIRKHILVAGVEIRMPSIGGSVWETLSLMHAAERQAEEAYLSRGEQTWDACIIKKKRGCSSCTSSWASRRSQIGETWVYIGNLQPESLADRTRTW
eukprot:874034-Pelagomonas_calceolata.AAC.2